jgi:toxin ParE1/3/4
VSHRIEFSPEAFADLPELYDDIAVRDGAETRNRIHRPNRELLSEPRPFSPACHRRDDLRPGLRVPGFERRAAIAFRVTIDTVTIPRILCCRPEGVPSIMADRA